MATMMTRRHAADRDARRPPRISARQDKGPGVGPVPQIPAPPHRASVAQSVRSAGHFVVAAVTWRLPEFAAEPTNRLDRSDAPQGILRYDKLAALATRSGSVQLETAATNVIVYCLGRLHGDVTDEEIEWLRAFHDGARTVDVAAEHGYSERDFYRVLNRLWVKLDVAGRAEAIAQASKRGWLR
jgi:hypothetical protein